MWHIDFEELEREQLEEVLSLIVDPLYEPLIKKKDQSIQ